MESRYYNSYDELLYVGGPTLDSRIKPPDVKIPVLQLNLKIGQMNTTHHLCNVHVSQSMTFAFLILLQE